MNDEADLEAQPVPDATGGTEKKHWNGKRVLRGGVRPISAPKKIRRLYDYQKQAPPVFFCAPAAGVTGLMGRQRYGEGCIFISVCHGGRFFAAGKMFYIH